MKNQYNIGQLAKVSMSRVSAHCNLSPYLSLVRRCVKNGGGFVMLCSVNESTQMAEIAGNAYDKILGTVEVPFDSLIF